MPTDLHFTPAEMAQLHLLVSQDNESRRVEMHHRSMIPFQRCVRQRLTRSDVLLNKMNAAVPSPLFVLDHQWGNPPRRNPYETDPVPTSAKHL